MAVDPLAPLTPAQINQQAQQYVTTQYAPVYANLNNQAAQVQAVSAKRAADDQSFQAWMAGQTAALQGAMHSFDQGVMANQSHVSDQINQAYANVGQDLTTAANNRAGNVSNNAQNTQVAGGIHDQRTYAQGAIGAIQTGTNQHLIANDQQLNATFANNLGVAAAEQAKRVADTWTQLSKIGDQKQQATLKEAADKATKVQQLLGQELNKANATRNYNAAVAKLGIAQYTAQTGRQNANTASTKAQNDAAYQQGQLQLGQARNQISAGRLTETQRHNLATEANNAAKLLKSTKGALTQHENNTITGSINSAYQSIYALRRNNPPLTDDQIRSVLNGNPQPTAGAAGGVIRFPTIKDPTLVQAALDMQNGGGLSQSTVKALQASGYKIPAGWIHSVGQTVQQAIPKIPGSLGI